MLVEKDEISSYLDRMSKKAFTITDYNLVVDEPYFPYIYMEAEFIRRCFLSPMFPVMYVGGLHNINEEDKLKLFHDKSDVCDIEDCKKIQEQLEEATGGIVAKPIEDSSMMGLTFYETNTGRQEHHVMYSHPVEEGRHYYISTNKEYMITPHMDMVQKKKKPSIVTDKIGWTMPSLVTFETEIFLDELNDPLKEFQFFIKNYERCIDVDDPAYMGITYIKLAGVWEYWREGKYRNSIITEASRPDHEDGTPERSQGKIAIRIKKEVKDSTLMRRIKCDDPNAPNIYITREESSMFDDPLDEMQFIASYRL